MKRKPIYILGTTLIVVLTLVTTQIVFLNMVDTAKSDPTVHYGDAFAGTLWITELDVSSVNGVKFDYLGVSHTNATDDWVVWESGNGNITANYTVDIENNHPEYFVNYILQVVNVDDNNAVMDFESFNKTYNANTGYDETGNLTVNLEFNRAQKEAGEQTLTCYLFASVTINNTDEAKNFTVMSEDRCIVGVDFNYPLSGTFGSFVEEANENNPPMWSYLSGWNESNRFDDEVDMLNNQTFVFAGTMTYMTTGSSSNPDWDIGTLYLYEGYSGYLELDECDFTYDAKEITLDYDNESGEMGCIVKIEYDVNWKEGLPHILPILVKFTLRETEDPIHNVICRGRGVIRYPNSTGTIEGTLKASISQDDDNDSDIEAIGWLFALKGTLFSHRLTDLKINYNNSDWDMDQTSESEPLWQSSCAYVENTLDISVSGISVVSFDISEDLCSSENEGIFIYGGDVGETEVILSV